MSSDIPETSDDVKITVKKSTFSGLVIGVIILVGISAFFAGTYVTDSDETTNDELAKAIAKIELKILQNQLPTAQPAAQLPVSVRVTIGEDPIIGDAAAPITILEFSDFQCPYCAKFHTQTLPSIMEQYIEQGMVKIVFKDFPIQSIHPNAVPASVAAQCAHDQEKFKEMHDVLFENQKEWNKVAISDALSLFAGYASDMELDVEAFELCVNSGKHIEGIRGDLNEGRSYGVTGTPGFFVGNNDLGYVELKGAEPFENFKQVIDAQIDA